MKIEWLEILWISGLQRFPGTLKRKSSLTSKKKRKDFEPVVKVNQAAVRICVFSE